MINVICEKKREKEEDSETSTLTLRYKMGGRHFSDMYLFLTESGANALNVLFFGDVVDDDDRDVILIEHAVALSELRVDGTPPQAAHERAASRNPNRGNQKPTTIHPRVFGGTQFGPSFGLHSRHNSPRFGEAQTRQSLRRVQKRGDFGRSFPLFC